MRVKSILTENKQYSECFFFHSTNPCEPDMQDKKHILKGNDEKTFHANSASVHFISAHAKMSERFAETVRRSVSGSEEYCQRANTIVEKTLFYWDAESNNFFYKLVT